MMWLFKMTHRHYARFKEEPLYCVTLYIFQIVKKVDLVTLESLVPLHVNIYELKASELH